MMPYMSSSSSSRLSQGYDVFMSFRGEDTRTGFTSHLYDALIRNDIKTYKDDKTLEIGYPIASELLEAIEASRIAIVVLSNNFATSKWCLEEIAKIVKCKEHGKLIVIPVFYHLDPSDVRCQGNCFQKGFSDHEANPEIAPQNVERWRDAFRKVGALSGFHVTQHRNEAEVVNEIVKLSLKDMPDTLPIDVTNGLVGINSRMDEVIRLMRIESSEVLFIGICGMSGIGKTTLAEAIFNKIKNKYHKSSFIENIKDISKQDNSTDLCKLQQKLLDDILKEKSVRVQSVKHGQTLLETKLRGLKVIIGLDDVNHVDQFTYLAGGHEWFGPGTRIMVTTTNIDLLNVHKIIEIYRCEEMENDEALRLFSQSAFEQGPPTHVYEKWSDDIVKLAGGLPLALNVYGSLLYGKEESYWKEMLKKLHEYPPKDVLGRLEVVFARLDSNQQETFMYIACFLKGRDIDLVKGILTSIGLYSECGITDLMNKFLITIRPDDCVWMHDLLQQMCWEILRKKSHIYGGIHFAIKNFQDIAELLLLKPKESSTIHIINQEKVEIDDSIDDPYCFSIMRRLKFLRISNVRFPQGLRYLSNDLRILEWFECSLESFPSNFKPTHMYELQMCYSQLKTLWNETLVFPNLRSIDLSFSKDLIKIPDLTSTPKLEKLILEGCTKLIELHEAVLLHRSLQYMNLMGCARLQCLGGSNIEMQALVTLLLSGCSKLEYIPEFGQNMKCLENLYLDGTNIKKLPESVGELHNLRKLDASETSIEEIPLSIRYLKRLRLLRAQRCPLSSQNKGFLFTNVDILSNIRELDISYCDLSVVPDFIGLLHRLIYLDVSGNDLLHLPASISLHSDLKMLCLNSCKRLQSLPKLSIVNEDTLSGLPIRFNYIMSGEEVDVSKMHAASNNTSPTISCLNCPRLAQNHKGSYLAERVLNSYLQLRTKYWMTPEAVFEIVGAGSKIPSTFTMRKADETFSIYGPWVGLAICAVISLRHIDANTETKYVVTAHIHDGETQNKIPVPVNLVPQLENQLVFYWTITDDLQRMVMPSKTNRRFRVSFIVEPRDGNLQVAEFGVCIIRDEDILQLKVYEDSTSEAVDFLFRATFVNDIGLISSHSLIQNVLTNSTIELFRDYETCSSLSGIQNIIQSLLEMNQKVLNEYKEASEHGKLLPFTYDFYQISHVTSKLYNYFVMLLINVSGSWLSVKLAMEQIMIKSRAEDYTYEEMRQQLDDLEAIESVRFSDKFVTYLAYISKQTVAFLRKINKENQINETVKLRQVLARVSGLTIAGIFRMVAAFTGDLELLEELKDITSFSKLLQLIQKFSTESNKWLKRGGQHMKARYERRSKKSRKSRNWEMDVDANLLQELKGGQHMKKASYKRELKIREINVNAILLQELKKKFGGLTSATKRKEEMMTTIDKLEKNTNYISGAVDNMSRHAQTYSQFIRKVGAPLLGHFSGYGNLPVPRFGACFESDQHILQLKLCEDPMNEVLSNLFRATLFLPTDLRWLLRHEALIFSDEPFVFAGGAVDVLSHIRDIFIDIFEIHLDLFKKSRIPEQRWIFSLVNYDYYEICLGTSKLYDDFIKLLKNICGSWLSVKLALQQVIVETEAHKYTFDENTLQRLNDPDTTESLRSTYCFASSFASMCNQIVAFLKIVDEEHDFLEMSSTGTVKGQSQFKEVLNIIVVKLLSAMAAYMGNSKFRQEMNDLPSNSLWCKLNKGLSLSPTYCLPRECDAMRKISIDRELRIRDFYGNILVEELKNETPLSIVTHLERKINEFSTIIEDMSIRAQEYRHGITEARSTSFKDRAMMRD